MMASYGGLLANGMDMNGLNGLAVSTDVHDDEAMDNGQGSPIRRSTRVCAKRAAEKIIEGDDDNSNLDMNLMYQTNGVVVNGTTAVEPVDDGKRRRLANDHVLDQFSPAFGVRQMENGVVCLLSEDSSDDALPIDEVEALKKRADSLNKAAPTNEQRHARTKMIEQLKATLRIEETNLLMLRKLKEAQRQPHNTEQRAVQPNKSLQAQQQFQLQQQLLRQQQEQAAIKRKAKLEQHQQAMASAMHDKQMGGKPPMAHQMGRQPKAATPLDPASKQLQAKMALRKQLEKTLLAIKPPSPPAANMDFVPTVVQADFLALCGLDQVVQKVLRDRTVMNPTVPEPWQCAQCSIDFTPNWQTMGEENDDGERRKSDLYCEACAKTNAKRATRNAQTAKFKAEFVKALKNEAAISQMKDGNIDWDKLGLPRPLTPVQPEVRQQSVHNGNYHSSGSSSNLQNYSSSGLNRQSSNKPSYSAQRAALQQQQSSQQAAVLQQQQQQQQQQQMLQMAAMQQTQQLTPQQQLMLGQQMMSMLSQQSPMAANPYGNQLAMLMAAQGMGGGNNMFNAMSKDVMAQQQQMLMNQMLKK